jgi:hypothetical protein
VRGGIEHVAQAIAGYGQQPPFGVVGDAGLRPGDERALEGVGSAGISGSAVA